MPSSIWNTAAPPACEPSAPWSPGAGTGLCSECSERAPAAPAASAARTPQKARPTPLPDTARSDTTEAGLCPVFCPTPRVLSGFGRRRPRREVGLLLEVGDGGAVGDPRLQPDGVGVDASSDEQVGEGSLKTSTPMTSRTQRRPPCATSEMRRAFWSVVAMPASGPCQKRCASRSGAPSLNESEKEHDDEDAEQAGGPRAERPRAAVDSDGMRAHAATRTTTSGARPVRLTPQYQAALVSQTVSQKLTRASGVARARPSSTSRRRSRRPSPPRATRGRRRTPPGTRPRWRRRSPAAFRP